MFLKILLVRLQYITITFVVESWHIYIAHLNSFPNPLPSPPFLEPLPICKGPISVPSYVLFCSLFILRVSYVRKPHDI